MPRRYRRGVPDFLQLGLEQIDCRQGLVGSEQFFELDGLLGLKIVAVAQ